MEPIQRQMVFCCAEQWLGGLFHGVEPDGDGLRLSGGHRTGVYCTAAVDSGEGGFLWRRVAVEAQLPPDTSLRIYAYASDERDWDGRGDLDEWLRSLSGDPMPALRELFGPPVSDRCDLCLGRRGRYLWLMLELASAGEASPSVSRLRLWMGGDHMTDYLPAIYQSDDFTHRFLSIFDSMYADMERQVDGLPGRMDYEQADGELLRYLASWVGVEQGETAQALRRSVRTALADYEDRYTVGGVRRSVRELTGAGPHRDRALSGLGQPAGLRRPGAVPPAVRRGPAPLLRAAAGGYVLQPAGARALSAEHGGPPARRSFDAAGAAQAVRPAGLAHLSGRQLPGGRLCGGGH